MSEPFQDSPHGRRAVFREGLRRLMKPVAQYIEDRIDRLDVHLPIERTVLRPPGALPEREFLEKCYRCGNCVDVCPARAIRPMAGENIEQAGTPHIVPSAAACVVCEELACMKSCPSGAIQACEPAEIRMGLARVNTSLCVRSRGEDCTLCVDRCPFGSQAIDIAETGQVVVHENGCVGCGSCEFYCPTVPKAVTIDPL